MYKNDNLFQLNVKSTEIKSNDVKVKTDVAILSSSKRLQRANVL